MRFWKAAALIGCFIFGLTFVAPTRAHGDDWNKVTRFSVNRTAQLPGAVLQPNTTYVLRLIDWTLSRQVVQLYNADQTKLLATFNAVSSKSSRPPGGIQFTFIETEPGYPAPIKEWFYAGRTFGSAFIYPKNQAAEIASHARKDVLTAKAGDTH